jgi:hypothetical protein
VNPLASLALTHIKVKSKHFLEWICLQDQDEEQLLFACGQSGFTTTTVTALANLWRQAVLLHVSFPRYGESL